MVDAARRREDHPVRRVMAPREAGQRLAPQPAHHLGRPEDRAPERLPRIAGLLQPVEDHVVGRVEHLPDLLQDHTALDLDLVGRPAPALRRISASEVDGERQRPRT